MPFKFGRRENNKKHRAVSETLLHEVQSYIDAHYREKHHEYLRMPIYPEIQRPFTAAPRKFVKGLDELIGDLDEPFNVALLRFIDAKGKTDVEVYTKAQIDRRLFSKIRGGKKYQPSKRTALALAIALELTLEETDDLLSRAGYTLSHSQKFDVIIEYFIINGKYDLFEINEVLLQYDQPLLGGG